MTAAVTTSVNHIKSLAIQYTTATTTVQESILALPALQNLTFAPALSDELALANATTAQQVSSLTMMVTTADDANSLREKSLGVLFLLAGFFGLVCLIAKAVPKLFYVIIPSNTLFLMFTAITMMVTLAASIAHVDYCDWARNNVTALGETYQQTVPCLHEGYTRLQASIAGWRIQAVRESCQAYRALCLGSFANITNNNCMQSAAILDCSNTASADTVTTLGPTVNLTVTAPTAGVVTVAQCAESSVAHCSTAAHQVSERLILGLAAVRSHTSLVGSSSFFLDPLVSCSTWNSSFIAFGIGECASIQQGMDCIIAGNALQLFCFMVGFVLLLIASKRFTPEFSYDQWQYEAIGVTADDFKARQFSIFLCEAFPDSAQPVIKLAAPASHYERLEKKGHKDWPPRGENWSLPSVQKNPDYCLGDNLKRFRTLGVTAEAVHEFLQYDEEANEMAVDMREFLKVR